MKRIAFSFLASALLFFSSAPLLTAAAGGLLWSDQFYLGDSADIPLRGDVDSKGNYYFGGGLSDLDNNSVGPSLKAFVRKQNSGGGKIWMRTFYASDISLITGVAVDRRDDSVYVSGVTNGRLPNQEPAGELDAFIRKYDSDGNIQWTRQFGSEWTDAGLGIAVGPAGAVFITGFRETEAGRREIETVSGERVMIREETAAKTLVRRAGRMAAETALGKRQKYRALALRMSEYGHSARLMSEGSNLLDGFVRKYSAAGTLKWVRKVSTGGVDIATSVVVNKQGLVYVGGATDGAFYKKRNAGGTDGFLRAYTSKGSVRWTRQFGRETNDFIAGLAVGPKGNPFTIGTAGENAWAVKFDSRGARKWTRWWPDRIGLGVAADERANLYVIGAHQGTSGDPRAWIGKYSGTGSFRWQEDLTTGLATGVGVTPEGALFVSGLTMPEMSTDEFDYGSKPRADAPGIFVSKFSR